MFTFFKAGSEHAVASGEQAVAENERGLIEVTFVPGSPSAPAPSQLIPMGAGPFKRGATSYYDSNIFMSGGPEESYRSAGVTGLTGESSQTFGKGTEIIEQSCKVVFQLHLIVDETPEVTPLPGRTLNVQ